MGKMKRRESLQQRIKELEEHKRQLEERLEEARKDALTGLMNRFAFHEDFGGYDERRHEERKDVVSVAMLDVNNFKRVNDEYGHAEGDELLRTIARIALERVRLTDSVVRWGGDEILVVLPGARESEACIVMDDIKRRFDEFAEERYNHGHDRSKKVGVSFGVISGSEIHDLIVQADGKMYEAKNQGKR